MTEKKDNFFLKKKKIYKFEFNEEVAEVFEDMLSRSVPFYSELQNMVSDLVCSFSIDNTNIYDLGCSTGTTMLQVLSRKDLRNIKIIGLDYSQPMLDLAKRKLKDNYPGDNYEFLLSDLNGDISISNSSAVIMLLTLQFVRPLRRQFLIKKIYDGLLEGGCLIIIEKTISENGLLNKLFIDYYYDFKKRNGYSELEISQKREALENILVPYSLNENLELLSDSGFRNPEVFFKWYNFTGIIGVK